MKFCTVAALSCVATGVMAKEIPAGTIAVGGQTDVSQASTTTTVNGTDIDVDVTTLKTGALYYVAPNVGLGVLWDYEKTKTSVAGTSSTETTNLFGAMASYNISINEQMSIRPRVFFGTASVKNDPLDVSYFPSDHVSFDVGVSYESLSLRDDGLDIDADGSGFSFGLGFTAYLR